MIINKEELKDLKQLLKILTDKTGTPCTYCGVPSTDKEHVTPISWIENAMEMKQMGININVPKEVIVPSCRECNLMASDKVFKNISEKKKHIKEKLKKKYKKLLSMPTWEEKEINELSGELKRYVFLTNEIRRIVKSRLKY